jgi:hypothetical protein
VTGLPAVNTERVPVPLAATVPVGELITCDEVAELESEIVIPVESAFAGTHITARPANADKASNLILISTSGTGINYETFSGTRSRYDVQSVSRVCLWFNSF